MRKDWPVCGLKAKNTDQASSMVPYGPIKMIIPCSRTLAKRFEKWRNPMGVRGYVGLDLKQPTAMPTRTYPYNDE